MALVVLLFGIIVDIIEGSPERIAMADLVLGSAATPLDLALLAWLDAKSTRSGSKKTETAYTTTMAAFRAMLQQAGTDLDGDLTAISLLAQAWAGTGNPAPATFNQ